MSENELAAIATEAAFRVHREVGPGLLENAYVQCMRHELHVMGIGSKHEHPIPLIYKGVAVCAGYRLGLWIEEKLII